MKRKLPSLLLLSTLLILGYFFHPSQGLPWSSFFGGSSEEKPIQFKSPKKAKFAQALLTSEVLKRLNQDYYDTKAINYKTLLEEAIKGLNRSIPELLIEWPKGSNTIQGHLGQQKKTIHLTKLENREELTQVFRKIYHWIARHYQGELELREIEYAALAQMLRSLDPHSTLFTPEAFKEFKTQTQGEFGGIGIVIGLKDGYLTVINPLPGTPAGLAGLRSRDRIVKINEESTINMDLMEAVSLLRGKVGSKVNLELERKGSPTPISVTLTRAIIEIESVQAKIAEDPRGNVGIIKVKSFGEDTVQEVLKSLASFRKDPKLKALILDLRNNPGGLLDQAIEMADLFLADGRIVLTVGAQEEVLKTNYARAGEVAEEIPLLVLINEGSASASEIVSGALKKNNRALVLGRRSFGKGSVQSIYPLNDHSALKMTIAQYLTSDRASIQGVGIAPDIKLVPQILNDESTDLIEDKSFGEKDLEKHLISKHTLEEKPKYTLSYYKNINKKDEEENSFTQKIDPQKDEELKIALDLVLGLLKKPANLSALQAAEPILKKIEEVEGQDLAQALASKGLNWSYDIKRPPLTEEVKAKVLLQVKNSDQADTLMASQEQEIELTLENLNLLPFQRLIAYTVSDYYLLDNKEFLFGRIEPGEKKTASVKIKVPASALDRQDKVEIRFSEAQDFAPEPIESFLKIKSIEKPHFAYSLSMEEKGNSKPGQINPGDLLILKVKVHNRGKGLSQKTVLNLKNPEDQRGVYIQEGRQKLEVLKPGEEKETTLSLKLSPKFKEEFLRLELNILDEESLQSLSEKIKVPLAQTYSDLPALKALKAGPILSLNSQLLKTFSTADNVDLKGSVHDPSGLKDLSLYVGENKIYYQSFAKKEGEKLKSSEFATALKLEKAENNLITLMARDQDNLITRQSFYIYHP